MGTCAWLLRVRVCFVYVCVCSCVYHVHVRVRVRGRGWGWGAHSSGGTKPGQGAGQRNNLTVKQGTHVRACMHARTFGTRAPSQPLSTWWYSRS